MSRALPRALILALVAVFCATILFSSPFSVLALGLDADKMCTPVVPSCPCGTVPSSKGCVPGPNKFMCPCWDVTSGYTTTGVCVASLKCEARATSGANGFGLDKVAGILGDLFGKLMQGGQGGQQGGQPTGSTGQTCTTYTQTSDQLLASTNPCYQYVPSVSSSLTGIDGISSVGSNVSDLLNSALGGSNTNTNTNTNTVDVGTVLSQTTGTTNTTSATPTPQTIFSTTQAIANPANQANLAPGFSGDIRLLNSGGTVFGGSRDTVSNTVTTGFFGAETLGAQPQGVVANLCKNRPWASNFLSYVVSATFFDSLCSLRGYTVGTPAPAQTPVVTVVQSAPQQSATPATPVQPAATGIPPKADIWASPATVPLGSRTLIFWSSQGVTECTEASPDGNFSQNTLSGGASTAPITGPTTFTISCTAPDGSHITDNVTVNIAI